MNDEMFKRLMNEAAKAAFFNVVTSKAVAQPIHVNYRYLEHHPQIETNVTDADILKLHIDIALDTGDKELFMELTDQLKEVTM